MLDQKTCVFLAMKNQTLQQSLLSFSESLDENSQLLTLFPVVQSNNFGTVAQLQAISPAVGGYQQKSSVTGRDEVVISRLRIGCT